MSCTLSPYTTIATADSTADAAPLALTEDRTLALAVHLHDATAFDVLLTAPVQLTGSDANVGVPITLTITRRGAAVPLVSQFLTASVTSSVDNVVVTPTLAAELGPGHYVFAVTSGASTAVTAQATLNALTIVKYVV
jgi:hypothetical protein